MEPGRPQDLQALVDALRALATRTTSAHLFEIVRENRTIQVQFEPGSTSSVTLTTPMPTAATEARHLLSGYRGGKEPGPVVAPRPLSIKLRREGDDDKQSKAGGINREIQTGNPEFDDAVYIDTYAPAAAVLALLGSAETKSLIQQLVTEDCDCLTLDDEQGNISISMTEFEVLPSEAQRAERLVDRLALLASSLPPVRASGEKPAEDRTLLPIGCGCLTALLGLVVTPVVYFSIDAKACAKTTASKRLLCDLGGECCNTFATGLLGGFLLSVPFLFVFYRTIRGHSDSQASMHALQMTVLLLCLEIGIIVARLLFA